MKRARYNIALSLVACVASACDGSDTPDRESVPLGMDAAVDSAPKDAQSDTQDAIVQIGDASVNAAHENSLADATLDGSGDSMVTADNRLFPLAPGRQWTYEFKYRGLPCKPNQLQAFITVSKEESGAGYTDYTARWYSCNSPEQVYRQDEGTDRTWFPKLMPMDALIAEPVQDGHSWTYYGDTVTWRKADPVTVPAGTFNDCWRAQGTNPQNFIVFCRGVGPVLERGVGSTEAQLISKNF